MADISGIEGIKKILRLSIISAHIKNSVFLSVLLVAKPEHGKTALLGCFKDIRSVHYTADVSPKRLVEGFFKEVEAGKKTHLVVPDFLRVLSHGKKTVDSTVTLLSSFMEEGIAKTDFYGLETNYRRLVRGAVLTAITPRTFQSKQRFWSENGFLSRFLILFYEYHPQTIDRAHEAISLGTELKLFEPERLKLRRSVVGISPAAAVLLKECAKEKRRQLGYSTGFRFHKQIRALCMANAVLEGRKMAIVEDAREVVRLAGLVGVKKNV